MNNRHEKREQWSRIVALHEKSGQSVQAFCQERGLNEPSFYSWRKRLRSDRPITFALVDAGPAVETGGIELLLNGGERLRIPPDASILRMVLSVLRERP